MTTPFNEPWYRALTLADKNRIRKIKALHRAGQNIADFLEDQNNADFGEDSMCFLPKKMRTNALKHGPDSGLDLVMARLLQEYHNATQALWQESMQKSVRPLVAIFARAQIILHANALHITPERYAAGPIRRLPHLHDVVDFNARSVGEEYGIATQAWTNTKAIIQSGIDIIRDQAERKKASRRQPLSLKPPKQDVM